MLYHKAVIYDVYSVVIRVYIRTSEENAGERQQKHVLLIWMHFNLSMDK